MSFAKDFIQIGDTKKDVLEILGAPTGVSKYESLNEEVWRYGLSSITFKGSRVYEYTGGRNLKIRLIPSRNIEVESRPEFTTIGSTFDDVIYVLGTPDGISKYEHIGEEVWRYGLSSITFKHGKIYEYAGGKLLKVKILPNKPIGKERNKPISVDFGATIDEVLYVLGTPDSISKYESLNEEVWRYGLSSITFKNGRVYEYTGGQNLKIAINPNGKYLDIDESYKGISKYYSYNRKQYSVEEEEDYYTVSPVRPIPSISINGISPERISAYKHYKVKDYYGNYHPFIAENGSYYGQISEYTGRPKTVHVRGYFRRNGTYVRSHYRSRPRR